MVLSASRPRIDGVVRRRLVVPSSATSSSSSSSSSSSCSSSASSSSSSSASASPSSPTPRPPRRPLRRHAASASGQRRRWRASTSVSRWSRPRAGRPAPAASSATLAIAFLARAAEARPAVGAAGPERRSWPCVATLPAASADASARQAARRGPAARGRPPPARRTTPRRGARAVDGVDDRGAAAGTPARAPSSSGVLRPLQRRLVNDVGGALLDGGRLLLLLGRDVLAVGEQRARGEPGVRGDGAALGAVVAPSATSSRREKYLRPILAAIERATADFAGARADGARLVGVDRDRAWSKYQAFCVVLQSRSIIFFQSLRSSGDDAAGPQRRGLAPAGSRATLSTSLRELRRDALVRRSTSPSEQVESSTTAAAVRRGRCAHQRVAWPLTARLGREVLGARGGDDRTSPAPPARLPPPPWTPAPRWGDLIGFRRLGDHAAKRRQPRAAAEVVVVVVIIVVVVLAALLLPIGARPSSLQPGFGAQAPARSDASCCREPPRARGRTTATLAAARRFIAEAMRPRTSPRLNSRQVSARRRRCQTHPCLLVFAFPSTSDNAARDFVGASSSARRPTGRDQRRWSTLEPRALKPAGFVARSINATACSSFSPPAALRMAACKRSGSPSQQHAGVARRSPAGYDRAYRSVCALLLPALALAQLVRIRQQRAALPGACVCMKIVRGEPSRDQRRRHPDPPGPGRPRLQGAARAAEAPVRRRHRRPGAQSAASQALPASRLDAAATAAAALAGDRPRPHAELSASRS